MQKRLAAEVRRRAQGRCEYCRMPDTYYRSPFQIDHIIALQHGGKSTLDNLAYACFHCNTHKGPNVAGVDPDSGAVLRLFHPRTEDWDQHFSWTAAILDGRTPAGRATIRALAINDPDYAAVRRALLEEGVFRDSPTGF